MHQQTVRSILTLFVLALVPATIALSQATTSIEVPVTGASESWQVAQLTGPSKGKLFVVTFDQPNRRQTCRIQSFSAERLVCSRAVGGPRAYLQQQVVALIIPGNSGLMRRMVLGFAGGSATAIWGTVVLASICPPCAVAAGSAAFGIWGVPVSIICRHYKPDRLLYLASGQKLNKKLGYIQP
jgi:hypothetical protein